MSKTAVITQMSATRGEIGKHCRETRRRDEAQDKKRKGGSERRQETRERAASIKQHSNAKRNGAVLQKVLVQ